MYMKWCSIWYRVSVYSTLEESMEINQMWVLCLLVLKNLNSFVYVSVVNFSCIRLTTHGTEVTGIFVSIHLYCWVLSVHCVLYRELSDLLDFLLLTFSILIYVLFSWGCCLLGWLLYLIFFCGLFFDTVNIKII